MPETRAPVPSASFAGRGEAMRLTAEDANTWLASAERDLVLVVGGLLFAYLVETFFLFGWPPSKWDVLLISGWCTFILGLLLVRSVPARFERMLERLLRRGVLRVDTQDRGLKRAMELKTRLWGRVGAGVVAAAILLAFLAAFWKAFTFDRALLTVAQVLAGLVAGFYLGRMCAYGSFWRLLKKHGASIKLIPGHVDGAAGLKPLGDFYFYQALVASLPAVYTAVWLLLFPLYASPEFPDLARYQNWRGPYQGLLGVGILFEAGAFVLPMLGFHRLMAAEKIAYHEQMDKIAEELSQIEEKLAIGSAPPAGEAKALSDRRELLGKQYQSLEQMPTWPVDRSTRKKFSAHNGFLALPLVLDVANIQPTGVLKNAIEFLQKMS
jgi:hypothetical protein